MFIEYIAKGVYLEMVMILKPVSCQIKSNFFSLEYKHCNLQSTDKEIDAASEWKSQPSE